MHCSLQAPLSTGFSRQEYRRGCHSLLQGNLPYPGLLLIRMGKAIQLSFLNENTLMFEGSWCVSASSLYSMCSSALNVLPSLKLSSCDVRSRHCIIMILPLPLPSSPSFSKTVTNDPSVLQMVLPEQLLSIKYRKVSVHESSSRSCIPSLHSESSFPRHLHGQALFPLHSNVSFLMSFSLAKLLKISSLLSPNLLPNLSSLITLSNLYYGLFIHIVIVCVCLCSVMSDFLRPHGP